MKRLVGYSLSFCVRDIAEGKVKIEQITKIICGTKAATKAQWLDLLSAYSKTYWRKCKYIAGAIALQLYEEGKIEQPRLDNNEAPNIANGIWKEIN